MITPGPRTRSQARAEAAAGQPLIGIPPKFGAAVGDAGTPAAADGLARHGSLIPAYHFEDRVEDLSLERMLGTPFTVELSQRAKKATLEPPPTVEQESSFISVDLSAEEAVPDEPAPKEAPIADAAAVVQVLQISEVPEIAEDEEEEEEGFKLASALDALDLSVYDSDSGYEEDDEGEEVAAEEEDNIVEGGPLRGVPAPQGTHIRFEDDEEAEKNEPLVLKGVPPPEGRHVRFTDE